MNTQYFKTPIKNFIYRLVVTLFGALLLSILLKGKLVYLFSAILLCVNLPIFYIGAANLAKYDEKAYHSSPSYAAKGLVMGLLTTLCMGLFILAFSAFGGDFHTSLSVAYRMIYTPYMAMIGLKNNGFDITYILPPLVDTTVITLGYIAGQNHFSVIGIFRSRVLYKKDENQNSK